MMGWRHSAALFFRAAVPPPLCDPPAALQRRGYVFLPTSWKELKLRLRQKAYPTVLKVVLQRHARRRILNKNHHHLQYPRLKATSWLNVRRAVVRRLVPPPPNHNHHHNQSFLFNNNSNNQNHHVVGNHHLHYHHGPHHRGLFSRLRQMFTGKPSRRSTLPRALPKHRPFSQEETVQVTIEDYMEASWFDHKGRPYVARDETGRFVNPWISQSADGVKPLTVLWQWRKQRLQREYRELGWKFFLPTFQNVQHEQIEKAPLPKAKKPGGNDNFPKPSRASTLRFNWIGHSTCLIQLHDVTILTDPIFSERASPFPRTPIGIARAKPASCTISDLPEKIDICLISHDHYDHLDKLSVKKLRRKVGLWVVPLGMKQWMIQKAKVRKDRVVELEWWESILVGRGSDSLSSSLSNSAFSVRRLHSLRDNPNDNHPATRHSPNRNEIWISCLPVQHWCSRTLWDRNYRLWASFAVLFPYKQTFYFAGDTALPTQFPLFAQIRSYLPWPISMAALPIGAYEPAILNDDSHTNPVEAVQIHQELQARQSVAIHHGSFPLSEEPLDEPAQWLPKAAAQAGLRRDSFITIPDGDYLDCPSVPFRPGIKRS